MAQIKIYPSTQAQVQAVQNTVDEINGKITTPTYQVKTVTPSNVQQTVQADSGYTALSGVVVNPISALMPQSVEEYIMRNSQRESFSLVLNGNIPSFACYGQTKLLTVCGNITSIGQSAFYDCTSLQEIDCRDVLSINSHAFRNCTSLQEIDCPKAVAQADTLIFNGCTNLKKANCQKFSGWGGQFQNCTSLITVDIRDTNSIGNKIFDGCASLQAIDMRNTRNIAQPISATSLKLVDITNSHSATIVANAFSPLADLTILVADATDKAYYQSATNWSLFASKIKTVAEYEQEIGMTYDEYYLQVFGHARNEVAA